jgi:hypothetical protein
MDETELQHRLSRLAERTAPPPREALAEVVVARHRTQRRQTAGIAALVAAVAAVVIAVPSVTGGPSDQPVAASAPGTDAAVPVDVLAGPPRGSLAGDAAFVEGVRQLDWSPEGTNWGNVPDAPLDTRRVVFAGEVAGLRIALVAGENTTRPTGAAAAPERQTDLGALSEVAVAWFLGPAGAAPDQMRLNSVPRGEDPTAPAAMSEASTGALVVVAAPGDAVEVSERPEIAGDGSVSRAWQQVDAPDGVAEVALTPAAGPFLGALRYRVWRDGAEVGTFVPDGHTDDGLGPPEVPVEWLRPAPAPSPGDVMVDGTVQRVLSSLGVAPPSARVTVVWAGDVPAPVESRTARVHLIATTLPSGAVYLETSLAVALGGGGAGGTSCGSGIRPAGSPLAEQTFALRCDATDMSEHSDILSSLVVVAPPAAVSARALDLDGEVLAEFALTDGVAVVPFPERAADVETLSADGTVLETTRPLTYADLGD